MSARTLHQQDLVSLTHRIKTWATELGFQGVGISDIGLEDDEAHLNAWLDKGFHGSMDYMRAHGTKRSRPNELLPGTQRVICVRLDYTDTHAVDAQARLNDPQAAYVSRYALGRDYHKVLRGRLKTLARRIEAACQAYRVPYAQDTQETTSPQRDAAPLQQRVFVDSAPVLEKALARDAGLGWIGKHTNLINAQGGSWFFLGELFTNLPLPVDPPASHHCGSCRVCLDVCPTQAIVAPYSVDARRCISYLTIENKGAIPLEFRRSMGNRIYGCDDCQLFCPWNKFARSDVPEDFSPRHHLDSATLVELFYWTAEDFERNTRGSAIRRTGYRGWLRNLAVALGNASSQPEVIEALRSRAQEPDPMVREHIEWALAQHGASGHNGA